MEIIANTIKEAVSILNRSGDNDFQIEGDEVIEYIDDDSIYWSWVEEISNGVKVFRFYC